MCSSLGPATFVPEEEETEVDRHDWEQVILHTCEDKENLLATSLTDSDLTLFCDSSSFMEEGTRKARYAVFTLHQSLKVLTYTWN